MQRTLPALALILGGVLADALHAPVPRDLEVGIPPGSPTEWGRRFPAITPRGPLFPKTPGRTRPPVDPTRTVATPAIAKMDVRIADSFGIVRIITWDIPGHLRWVTGRPEVPNHPITGAAGLVPLPEPGSALYWTSTAALLRLLLHPQLVSEKELIAHLVEVGEPVLGVLRAANSEPALREPCRRIREKIEKRRRLVGPLPGTTPRQTMIKRFVADELTRVFPYDPEGGFGRRMFLFGAEIEPALIEYAGCDDSFLARNAVAALGRFRDGVATAALLRIAGETDDPVVLMRALAALGPHRAIRDASVLLERLKKADDPVDRVALIQAIGRVGLQDAVPTLLRIGEERSGGGPDLVQAALTALVRIPHGVDAGQVRRFAGRIERAAAGSPGRYFVRRTEPAPAPDFPDSNRTRGEVIGQLAMLLHLRLAPTDEKVIRDLTDLVGDKPDRRGRPRRGSRARSTLSRVHPPVQLLFLESLRVIGEPGFARLRTIVADKRVEPALRGHALAQQPATGRGSTAVEILGGRDTDEMKIYAFEVLAADGHSELESQGRQLLKECARAPADDDTPERRYLWLSALRALDGRGMLKPEELVPLLAQVVAPDAAHDDVNKRVQGMVDRLVADFAAGMSREKLRDRIDTILDLVVMSGINESITAETRDGARDYVGRQLLGLKGHRSDRGYHQLVAGAVVQYLLGFQMRMFDRQRAEFKPVVLLEEEILFALGRSRSGAAAEALVEFLGANRDNPHRAQACLALGMTGRAELARHLVPFLLDSDGFARFCAYESLRRLTGQDFWADWMYGELQKRGAAAEKYFRWCNKNR